jgi:hypothetical protein
MMPKKLLLTVTGLAAACALLSFAAAGRVGRPRPGQQASSAARKPGPGYGSYLQVAGVQPMEYDAATRGARRDGDAWVLGDIDLESVRQLVEEPRDLDALAAADPKWVPTQTWKLRHGGATPFAIAKEHCGARHLVNMEDLCRADIDVVVERKSDEDGHVVYARPRTTEDATDECRAYADCVARNAWLTRPTPLPGEQSPYYAFKAGDVRVPLHGTKADWQQSFESDIKLIKDNLAGLKHLDQSDPNVQQNIELQEDLLAHLEWMASL